MSYKLLFILKIDESFMSRWALSHYIHDLRQNGHDVDIFNIAGMSSKEEVNSKLWDVINSKPYHYLFNPFNKEIISLEVIDFAKDKNIVTVLMAMDNGTVPFEHLDSVDAYSIIWLFSPVNSEHFYGKKSKVLVMPYASSPDLVSNISRSDLTSAMVFIGTPHGSRSSTINEFTKRCLPIRVYGGKPNQATSMDQIASENKQMITSYFKFESSRKIIHGKIKMMFLEKIFRNDEQFRMHSAVDTSEMLKIYATSKLCLAFSSARNTGALKSNLNIINLRSFEIPMAYGVQLIKKSPEIEEYFEDGTEIITYTCVDEMIDKSIYYTQKCPDETVQRLKENARKRAVGEHTWMHRFEKIFESIRR